MDPVTMMALASMAAGTAGGMGLFGSKKQGGMNQEQLDMLIARRQSEIANFSNALAESRTKYLAQLNNLSNLTYDRFSGQSEARFGGRGLSVTGGAFQSALAKKAAELQAQGGISAAEMERQDINRAEDYRSQLFGQYLGGSSNIQPASDPYAQLWGNLAGAGVSLMGSRGMYGDGADTTGGTRKGRRSFGDWFSDFRNRNIQRGAERRGVNYNDNMYPVA